MSELRKQSKYCIDGECFTETHDKQLIDEIRNEAEILLSNHDDAVTIRSELRKIMNDADNFYLQSQKDNYYGTWLDCLHGEIREHIVFRKNARKDNPCWNEKKKREKLKLAKRFLNKNKSLLIILKEMNISDQGLSLRNLTDNKDAPDISIVDLLYNLEQKVIESSQQERWLERYVGREFREPKGDNSISFDAKAFVAILARQLFFSLYLPSGLVGPSAKLIMATSNLRHIQLGDSSILTEKNVHDFIHGLDLKRPIPAPPNDL